jgi:hypothetical protein
MRVCGCVGVCVYVLRERADEEHYFIIDRARTPS